MRTHNYLSAPILPPSLGPSRIFLISPTVERCEKISQWPEVTWASVRLTSWLIIGPKRLPDRSFWLNGLMHSSIGTWYQWIPVERYCYSSKTACLAFLRYLSSKKGWLYSPKLSHILRKQRLYFHFSGSFPLSLHIYDFLSLHSSILVSFLSLPLSIGSTFPFNPLRSIIS